VTPLAHQQASNQAFQLFSSQLASNDSKQSQLGGRHQRGDFRDIFDEVELGFELQLRIFLQFSTNTFTHFS
jgi:hypothetical protein